MGKIIAIANQKGGVGKTTTAVNLSSALGAKGKKTLLVDIDPQGNSSSGVGVDRRKLKNTMYEVLIGETPAKDARIHTAVSYTHLDVYKRQLQPRSSAACGPAGREEGNQSCPERTGGPPRVQRNIGAD